MNQLVPISPGTNLSATAQAVVQAISRSPRTASYASAGELAELADVSAAAVTRAAQALGFSGWPALQQEVRQRYFSSLSTLELADTHRGDGHSRASMSLRQDRDNVAVTLKQNEPATIQRVARTIAEARHGVVVASGSYAGVGQVLAHNARLCGYDVVFASEGPLLTNELSRLGPGDTLIAMSFWRPYVATVQAAQFALDLGAAVCAITDSATGSLAALGGDRTLVVPAEGVSHFPSLTSAMAITHALCAEVALVDPQRTRETVAAFEKSRDAFHLLQKERLIVDS
jgi:DNA-binding MurR/RpiR family transcriptional regulator